MGLGPIDDDVTFDHGACGRLISACNGAAGVIDRQRGSRTSWAATASKEFRGHFADLFAANASTADSDAGELSFRLREVSRFAGLLATEATSEQHRRQVARDWKAKQDDKNFVEKGASAVGHFFGGEDKPPVGDMPTPSNYSPGTPPTQVRQTPSSGSGGGGGGTSSARPDDLATFANGSRGANDDLTGKKSACHGSYTDFVAGCQWGHLDATGVLTGFDKWLAANHEDVRWATVVGHAFAAAGGSGAVSTLTDSSLQASLKAAGVTVSREDLQIDPAIAYGNPPTSGYADDPVNAATGNFIENEADLGFAGGCADLALTRTYNSFSTDQGAFGVGWSSWTEARLDLDDDAARMTLPDGRVVVFPRLGTGWDRATGESLWLARDGEDDDAAGHLAVAGNDGARWSFGPDRRLREHSTGRGTGVRLTHDDQGRLVRLEHERGRAVDLVWRDERVVEAQASDGRRVHYAYDDLGRLTGATTALGTRRYRWNDQGLVSAVVDADGVVEAENVYDSVRRVVTQRSHFGRTSRFAYLPGRVTVVSDEDGTRANTWISDHRGRVVGVLDSDDRRQSTSYDERGNPVAVTERDGAVTVHEYDGRGRRTRTVTPSGADLTFGYDEHDRVTTVVTESGAVTEYSYAQAVDRSPSVVVDPEGGRTELTWTGGLLRQVVDPTGVVVRFTHDEHGDLVATTDALGHVARLERDAHGRVVAAVTPGGARTAYAYGPSGLLVARRDADGATTRFEHTTAGRLAAVVDPTGARTEIERGSHGEESRTIDPLGRSVTRRLDDLGNVASMELPDGSTWRFAHDALSRLVATTDPTGATWTTEHDATGAPSATVDPTGVRRSFESDRAAGVVSVDDGAATLVTSFDPLGRLTATEGHDGSAAMTVYDRCGRAVELLDAEGGLTRIERDAAGRVVAVTSPSGAVTRREHDVCGRPVAVVDPTGARTTQEYDVDGRVVRQTLPTGEVAWVEHDVVGRVSARYQPGRGVARYTYDAAGRVTRSSDTWNGRRTYRYDAAGQLVEVVNGNGGVTRWTYDANGRATTITDPLGQRTTREFDAMNRCTAQTDPLGRTTRAGYDAAGRIAWQVDPDGRRTTWTYDGAGRTASMAVDGRTTSSLTRDLRARTVTVTDTTRDDGVVVRHELEWDRRGQLVRRTRDGRGVSWAHDADGRRTALTTPDGLTTRYDRDAAGRVTVVEHPLLGRVTLERDAAGRLVAATAGGVLQTWEHEDGFVVGHTVGDADGFSRTAVVRDDDGRITAVERDGRRTAYGYDEACQLIETRLRGGDAAASDESVTRWTYDAAGRLVTESLDGAVRTLAYDAAGQLGTDTDASGRTTRHAYDELGRRTRTERADGGVRELEWSPRGYLSAITERDATGAQQRRTDLHVDAEGELATVDGAELFWDSADGYAPSLLLAGDTPVVPAGPVTGIGSDWSTAGWRTARSTDAGDPWDVATSTGLPDGLGMGSSGELTLPGGMEWLGARVYDPASRGFLSVDPLEATVGAGWSGNPYSYAGNDPLHATDPTGLKPLTDSQLDAYIDAHQGALHAAGQWMENNWEYVAAGAMIVAGTALMFLPVPILAQAAGSALLSAGIDAAVQKYTTGGVNWKEVAISGAVGAVSFGAGAGVGAMVGKAGMTMGRAILTGAATGATEGAVGGAGNYLLGPGPHNASGLLRSTTVGGLTGGVTGGAGGAAGHALASRAGGTLDAVSPDPNILSGHGGIHPSDTATFTVPEGSTVHFYSPHDTSISDPLGNSIELGHPPVPTQVAGPGDTVPDYVLHAPTGLHIAGNPTTVTDPTRLSSLVGPGMGDVHWAACRNVTPHAARP